MAGCNGPPQRCVLIVASYAFHSRDLAGHNALVDLPESSALIDLFDIEARRLWSETRGEQRLTTVQAGCILAMLSSAKGNDEIMWSYMVQTVTLASNMALFAEYGSSISRRERVAQTFAAWGFFRCQA